MKTERAVPTPTIPTDPKAGESNGAQVPIVREATWEEFQEANRKVGILHDGLFRRLAEHDRER